MESKKFVFSQEVKKILHEKEIRSQEKERYNPEIEKTISGIYEFLGPEIGCHFINPNVVLAIAGLKGLADIPWVMLNKERIEKLEKLNEKIEPHGLRIIKLNQEKNKSNELIPQSISIYSLKGLERKTKTTKIPGIPLFDSRSGWEGFGEWNLQVSESLKLAQERGEISAEVNVNHLESLILGYPDQAILDFEECLRKGDVRTDLRETNILSVSPYAQKYSGAVPEFDFYPKHANDPEIVAYVEEARLILKHFYNSQWFQKIVSDPEFLKAREESEKAKEETLKQRLEERRQERRRIKEQSNKEFVQKWYENLIAIASIENPKERYGKLAELHRETLDLYISAVKSITPNMARRKSGDERTIAAVVAHIAAWEEWQIQVFTDPNKEEHLQEQMNLRGYHDVENDKMVDFKDVNDFNAYQTEKYSKWKWKDIRQKAIATATKLKEIFPDDPPDEWINFLENTLLYQWKIIPDKALNVPVGWYLWMVSLEHEAVEHRADIAP